MRHGVGRDVDLFRLRVGIARHLGLSPKTVYTYKRCTMHKLGFTRNTELYHWLINGGLDTERKEIA
ncbi:TPA: LuxR C-terminal-related transcriptional regulator [Serratia marcescens]|uniref:LuxR C-terminal-related transcriptional regulator n=1 Tax=Serratia marcescens TaxID=615 RepID=UPI0009B54319